MKSNMSSADRIIRTSVAVIIGGLYFGEVIPGTTAIILGLLAVILILTSTISFCPLYAPFKFSTRKAEKPA